jgi:outer membrane protein TolC
MFAPIYNGGALRAGIKIATAQEEESIAHFAGVAPRTLDEVEVALTKKGWENARKL